MICLKKWLVGIWLIFLLSAVGALFWYNEWIYHLPTPVPVNYKHVYPGQLVRFKGDVKTDHNKPTFLHFFNPDCPCSRFNIASFQSIVKQYRQQVNFAIVIMSKKKFTVKEIQDKFGLNIPVLFDASIAPSCGVYSTPQAVLLNTDNTLYFRGNYNSSRYCTNEKTSFAKIAIAGLLDNQQQLAFSPLALKAYGCSLPGCKK